MKKEDFKPLDGSWADIFHKYAAQRLADGSCERAWCNLRLYCDTYNWQCAECDDRLWIASFESGYIFFPLGELPGVELLAERLQEFAAICGKNIICGDIPCNYPELFPEAEKCFEFEFDAGDCDYIYDLAHLHSFSGSKLRKRHNQVRQFEREYEGRFITESISANLLPEVTAMAAAASCGYWHTDSGTEEKLAIAQLEKLWDSADMPLDGVLIRVDGKVAGFSIFSAMNNDMADVHFEKADRSLIGCGAKLTAVLTEYLLQKNYRFMNREQDLNIEGLRRAKLALDPDRMCKRLNTEIFLPYC